MAESDCRECTKEGRSALITTPAAIDRHHRHEMTNMEGQKSLPRLSREIIFPGTVTAINFDWALDKSGIESAAVKDKNPAMLCRRGEDRMEE